MNVFTTIRAQLALLALLPAALLVLASAAFFATTRNGALEAQFRADGEGYAAQLARAAEMAVASQNPQALVATLKSALSAPSVLSSAIVRMDGSVVNVVHRDANATLPEHTLEFNASIFNPRNVVFGEIANPVAIGVARVTLDAEKLHLMQTRNWALSGFGGIALLSALSLAVFGWSRRISRPISALSEAVRRLTRGDLGARVKPVGNGEVRELELGVNALAHAVGESQRALSDKVDAATRALKAQRDEATATSNAKSRFLAAASHDLRQPMHALGLFCSALEKRVHEPEQQKIIGNIQTSLQAMEGLFESLLDFSRLDAGRVVASIERVPIATFLDWINLEYGQAARDKGLRFRVRACEAWLYADKTLLRQVLMNLVANAIRYTETGGIMVGAQKRGEQLRISVWDTGVGIAEDSRNAIFDEFVQLNHSRDAKEKGLGLGLSIASKSAKLMNATIDVRSTLGRGSHFSIQLPLAKSRLVARDEASPPLVQPSVIHWEEYRVMLVEDDDSSRAALTELLSQWGCAVRSADSIENAVAQSVDHWQPDLIVTDYRLRNNETGADAVAQLTHVLGFTPPVVVVTGELTIASEPAIIAHPEWVVIRKPASATSLRNAMSAALERRRVTRLIV